MTAGQHINYEALAQEAMQEAMRGVVRAVLTQVAAAGLGGDHHFYIAFNTQAPGVAISRRLKEKYPHEMTIVMQHRFWDLEVSDERFSVKLTFDGIPERLVVPFKAVKVFYDPSVPYGLQFEESELATGSAHRSIITGQENAGLGAGTLEPERRPLVGKPQPLERERKGDRARRARLEKGERQRSTLPTEGNGATPAETPRTATTAEPPEVTQPAVKPVTPTPSRPQPVLTEVKSGNPAPSTDNEAGAKIVDLSKFRPKKP